MAKTSKPPSPVTIALESIKAAIVAGNDIIKQGKPKIEAAMTIYCLIGSQPQEIVLQAFVEGATLTPKGALTYWYNCKRKLARDFKMAN